MGIRYTSKAEDKGYFDIKRTVTITELAKEIQGYLVHGKTSYPAFTAAADPEVLFAWALDEKITLDGFGDITVDIGFGGNFFVIVEAAQLGIKSIDPEYTTELIKTGIALRKAANEQISVQHPIKKHIHFV